MEPVYFTFSCSQCGVEIEAPAVGAGTEVECPQCTSLIRIPEPPPEALQPPSLNPMASSAAAREEKHFAVPVHDKPAESLIKKAQKPLEIAAKESDRRMRVKTIRHSDCIEVGKDKFDEIVSDFLDKVGERFIVSLTPIAYTHSDPVTQKLVTDFGVMIVYKG
jgi:DNA-directed RNA polymerase subunit RPC12/RpoP